MALFNPVAMRQNMGVAEYCRTSISALSGGTAGVLGLTGFSGFAFYLVCSLSLFLGLVVKAGTNKPETRRFFPSRKSLLFNGQVGALFTFILFWTFLYGMVHVY